MQADILASVPWYPLLITGGVLFWVVVIVISGFLMATVGSRNPSWALPSVPLTCFVLAWFFFGDLSTQLSHVNTQTILIFSAVYFPLGISYATLRWVLLVLGRRDEIQELIKEWVTETGVEITEGKLSPEQRKEFSIWLKDVKHDYRSIEIPSTTKYKNTLACWILWWPFSLPVWLIGDSVKNLVVYVVRFFSGIWDRIAQKLWF